MQTSLNYRTNRDLFSNYYLNEHFPETEVWDEINDDDLREKRAEIVDLWERERDTVAERTESSLEEKFIRPLFRILGIPFEVEETVQRGQRRPDYGFFPSEDEARNAFSRKKKGGDFYENATAVADAKRWGRPLDTRGSGEHKRDFENPSYQIHVYLQETPAQWAVLTDGKKWRLYYGPTSHRLDSYYEVDLPTVLEKGDLDDFKYFYLFFRNEAFIEDAGGDSFLDDVYDESNVFAQELGEDLQDNIYEAIKVLSEGYLQYSGNGLDEEDLGLIHDSSLIYLYRLIFVLYAEAEGRQLLDTDNEIYEEQYSLNALKQEVADELDSADPKYRDWQDNMSDRLNELFSLIDQGSKSQGIPEEDLYIPAYNGGLFRTDPDENDSPEARFLANHTVGDSYLARVVELLTRSQNGDGKIFVDYSSLDVRHLGSIYEGLLEYKLDVADGPLTLDNGEYVSAEEGDEVVVQDGEVYLMTGSGERKATGSYYTPEYVVEYIVDETLGPLVAGIREDLVGQTTYKKRDEEAGTFADQFAERVFELKILDPAMGSGHFLTSAVDYLAREIIDAQERQAEQQGVETIDKDHDINWARRKVAQRCIYGVDLNPLATELAKVSLWLRTLAAEQPLAFLDHRLKTGNSLIGSDIEDVLTNGDDGSESGQLTLQQSFDRTRQQAIEHVMDCFQDLLSINNETLEDAKEMEDVYDEVRDDPLYQNLLAMANVHTAEQFGLDVPVDSDERMARALKNESWVTIEKQDWFRSAQAMAADERFFHWELDFPVAFYDVDGDRLADAGFDAVIGNPPYGDILSNEQKDCLEFMGYESGGSGNNDIFRFFVERSIDLAKSSKKVGLILPNTCLDGKKYSNYRKCVSKNSTITEIVDFKTYKIFNVEVFTHIFISETSKPTEEYSTTYKEIKDELGEYSSSEVGITPGSSDDWFPKSELFIKLQENDKFSNLSAICECADAGINYQRVDVGWQNRDKSEIAERILYTGEKQNASDHQYIKGEDIQQYIISVNEQRWLRADYDDRVDEGETVSVNEKWGETVPKIVSRQTGDTIVAAVDEVGYYTGRSLHSTRVLSDNYSENYIMSMMNSKVVEYYYTILAREKGRSMAQVNLGDLRQVPIPKIDFYDDKEVDIDQITTSYENILNGKSDINVQKILDRICDLESEEKQEFISVLADRLGQLKRKRESYNLNFIDYINQKKNFTGPDLGSLYQPPEDISNSIFNSTTDGYEGLKFGSLRIEQDSDQLTVHGTARFKPTNEDEYATDRWGYTESDEQELMRINVDGKLAELIYAFIPRVFTKELDGFIKEARKSISLLDRLEKIQLPSIEEVEDDLQRYRKQRDQANILDENIQVTMELIDNITYSLYRLSNNEIKEIEEVVEE